MAWSKPFLEVESTYLMVVADVRKIQEFAQHLAVRVGAPKLAAETCGVSIWENIDHLRDSLRDLESTNESLDDLVTDKIATVMREDPHIGHVQEDIGTLRAAVMGGDNRLAAVETKVMSFDNQFLELFPMLTALCRRSDPVGDAREVDSRLDRLEKRCDGLAELRHVETPVGALEQGILDLREQVRLLELRVVGGGVAIGPTTFQSFEELVIWTKTGVPVEIDPDLSWKYTGL
jgi:hypothetical protein